MHVLMQTGSQAAGGGIVALFLSLWCFVIVLGVAQFAMFIVALVQILSRSMASETKLLWGAVAWFVPVIGPILWWTIGVKQNPESGPPSDV